MWLCLTGIDDVTTHWIGRLGWCAVALALIADPAAGFNARDADILKLRLGMGETEVIERLQYQGITGTALLQRGRVCPDRVGAACLTTIVARTGDGVLTIELADPLPEMVPSEPWVRSILYRLEGRLPGEPEMIRAAVLEHFGEPSSRQPLAWCEHPGPTGLCAADRPRLSLEPGPGTATLLLLTIGSGR